MAGARTHARPGPTRARRLVEHFGNVAAIFRASLTELEATGLLAVSAQALGTGRSLELAQEELEKAKTVGAAIVTFDDPAYPARLRQIYDPPLVLYGRGDGSVLSVPGMLLLERAIQLRTVPAWRSVSRSICPRTDW